MSLNFSLSFRVRCVCWCDFHALLSHGGKDLTTRVSSVPERYFMIGVNVVVQEVTAERRGSASSIQHVTLSLRVAGEIVWMASEAVQLQCR